MCGICGYFGGDDSFSKVFLMLKSIEHRGVDGSGVSSKETHLNSSTLDGLSEKISEMKESDRHLIKNSVGHNLHSIVDHVMQPLVSSKGILVANCELYNWKELNKTYNVTSSNDAETLFKILDNLNVSEEGGEERLKEFLQAIDGVYAFAYWDILNSKLLIARDIVGEKPIWFSDDNNQFAFASEKKSITSIGMKNIEELNPRSILLCNLKKETIVSYKKIKRDFFKITKSKESNANITKKTENFLVDAIKKRIPDKKFGLLFSGGIDSVFIAKVLKDLGYDFVCYTSALVDDRMGVSQDLIASEEVAKELGLNLKIAKLNLREVTEYLKVVVPLIEDNNVVKVGVGLTMYSACELAKKDGVKVIFSGLGSEELFAGYERHKDSIDVNKECLSGFLKLYERDLYRDDVIAMKNQMEMRLPFLDTELIKYSLSIPEKMKLDSSRNKIILRDISKKLGISETIAERKKKAAQYGSKFDRAIQRLAEKEGIKKSEYLNRFHTKSNVRLGVLWSGGKDSAFATWTMIKQNYEIACLISLKSKNVDSYMFHTPNIDIVELHAEASGFPIIIEDTSGEKEKELLDLKSALSEAKKIHKVEGVVTGALYSDYQRKRIEKICDELDLKIFSPLWHINQEKEMKELLRSGFSIVLSCVAAEGLDESWLGRDIDENDVEKLVLLNKKYGLNVAGEGGEFESLVLDAPFFKKKIVVDEGFNSSEGSGQARFNIKKAHLEEKTKQDFDKISSKYIELNAFLKVKGIASTGGHSKNIIRSKHIKVNNIVETRNKRKLVVGDIVEHESKKYIVTEELTKKTR